MSVVLLGFVIAIPAYRTYLSRQASPETLVDNWNTALRQEDLDLFFSLLGEQFDPTEDYWLSLLEQPVYLELLDYQIGDHGKMAKLRVRVSAGREEVYSTVSYMFAVREEGKWVFSSVIHVKSSPRGINRNSPAARRRKPKGLVIDMSLDNRIAVLIDADNVSDKYIKYILDEGGQRRHRHLQAHIRRLDQAGAGLPGKTSCWTTPSPRSSNTAIPPGKNATDSAMIIDAMDILYSGHVDGFCLVSSDSDFTRLAARLRESGMQVLGMGEKKTPTAFIAACNKFEYLEILAQPAESSAPRRQTEEMTPLETVKAAVLSIMDEISDEDEWVSIS